MKNHALLAYTIGCLIFMYGNNLFAQKLPNTQSQSKWLPATVKIDGKLTEWNDTLMAFQKSNHLEYTIASDSTRLYLAFRSHDKATTAKIMAGGISMMINTSGKKTKNEGPEITFPVGNASYSNVGGGALRQDFAILTDSAAIVGAMVKFKEIRLTRVPEITDQTLSIYNEYGVKMQLRYAAGALTGEYIIPLKLLGINKIGTAFSYNIKLNGVALPSFNSAGVPAPPPGMPANRSPGSDQSIVYEINTPTDFWGNYTLLGSENK